MIIDKLSNLKLYTSVNSGVQVAIDYIANTDLATLAKGKYPLANGVVANVQEYQTKVHETALIECHRKFWDIQFIVSGEEHFGYALLDDCEQLPYKEDKDFQELKGDTSKFLLKANMFAICLPEDAHQPGLRIDEDQPQPVKKIVFKLPVE